MVCWLGKTRNKTGRPESPPRSIMPISTSMMTRPDNSGFFDVEDESETAEALLAGRGGLVARNGACAA